MQLDTHLVPALRTGLEDLADRLEAAVFRLPFPGREDHERTRVEVVRGVREYLLPRLRDPDAPVVASIVGPTGVGKSTILNTLAQDRISETGVLRPTTKNPVLWAHRDHAGRYWSEFVARVRERVGPRFDVVVGDDQLTAHLTLVDTPPVDHEEAGTVSPAREVLALSDLCVFVTSAGRYADASGWQFLHEARTRGVPILFVLNRLPADPALRDRILADFASRLYRHELLMEPDPSLIFAVSEGQVERWHGGLAPADVGLLRKELGELADPDFRSSLIVQTTSSAVRSIASRSTRLAAALETEAATVASLQDAVDAAYREEHERLRKELESGELAWLAKQPEWAPAAVDLTGLVTRRAGDAAQRTAVAWAAHPVGERFLEEGGQGLWRHGHDATYETQRLLEEWFEGLADRAARATRRGKMWARGRRRAASTMWRLAVDPDTSPPAWFARKFGAAGTELVGQARAELAEVLRRALLVDAERFIDFLGQAAGGAALPEEITAIAANVLDLIEGRADAAGGDGEAAAVTDPSDAETSTGEGVVSDSPDAEDPAPDLPSPDLPSPDLEEPDVAVADVAVAEVEEQPDHGEPDVEEAGVEEAGVEGTGIDEPDPSAVDAAGGAGQDAAEPPEAAAEVPADDPDPGPVDVAPGPVDIDADDAGGSVDTGGVVDVRGIADEAATRTAWVMPGASNETSEGTAWVMPGAAAGLDDGSDDVDVTEGADA